MIYFSLLVSGTPLVMYSLDSTCFPLRAALLESDAWLSPLVTILIKIKFRCTVEPAFWEKHRCFRWHESGDTLILLRTNDVICKKGRKTSRILLEVQYKAFECFYKTFSGNIGVFVQLLQCFDTVQCIFAGLERHQHSIHGRASRHIE